MTGDPSSFWLINVPIYGCDLNDNLVEICSKNTGHFHLNLSELLTSYYLVLIVLGSFFHLFRFRTNPNTSSKMHKLSNINKMLVVAPKILTNTEAASLTVRMSLSSLVLSNCNF